MFTRQGKCSSFGGSHDMGVAPKETLALYPKTLARSLDQPIYNQHYCAMRWDYAGIQRALGSTRGEALAWLRKQEIFVSVDGRTVTCVPVDYGPSRSTGRLIDLGPKVLGLLGIDTDDVVSVTLPDACALLD